MKNPKRVIKITSFVISGIGLLYIGLVVYAKLSGKGPLYLNPCYNTLITRPLAWLGSESAQEKMARFWMKEELREIDDLRLDIKKIEGDLKEIEASRPQEKEWTWEDDLRERRNDTALIQKCIDRIKMGYDDCEVECVDMAAHAFNCQGRNIYFNEDFGFEMEYPQDFLPQIDRWGLSMVSHGGEIISPDTTVVIDIAHYRASLKGEDLGNPRAVEVDTGWVWLDRTTCLREDITEWVNGEIQRVISSGGIVYSHKRHTKQQKMQLNNGTSITIADLVLTLTGRNRKHRNIYEQSILRIYYDAHGNFLESQSPLQCFVGVEYPDKYAQVGKEIIGYIKKSCWRLQYTYY